MTSQDTAWNVTSIHKLPSCTPAAAKYTNLTDSTQYARNNFNPSKRSFSRVPSAEENITALERILRTYWGHSHFRGPQKEICEAVTKGQDVVLVAPTGLGKSVCFQVPALAMEYGITLVISPLLALMKDQVRGLKEKGIKAEMLYEKSPLQELAYIKTQLRMGHPELRLLYVTPETLFSAKISHDLRIAYDQKQLSRLVIDEAHVIEEWGMTFRGAYRDLGRFRQTFPDVPITALTASATEEVRADILSTLGIDKECLMQRVEPFNRRNLFYEIRYQGPLSSESRIINLANFINGFKPEALKRNMGNGVASETVTGLVYCRSRGACDDVAEGLNVHNIKAMSFHAKLSDERRHHLLQMWQYGEIECIVATIAFGMPNVRYVVHYDMPKSFEGYYQETGRAGRDGHLSRCLLYYSREDALALRRLIDREANAAEAQRKKAEKSKNHIGTDVIVEDADKARTRVMNSFKELQHYAEADRVCRHVAICRYFGEEIDASKESILKQYCDKMCDVCSNPAAVRRRAFAVTQDIDIASQVVRPQRSASQRPFVPAVSQIDEMSEGPSTPGNADVTAAATQKDHVPSSLRDLHGSDLQTPSSEQSHPVAVASRMLRKEESADMIMPSSTPPESESTDTALVDGFDVNGIDDLAVDGDANFGRSLVSSGDKENSHSGSSDPLNLHDADITSSRKASRVNQHPFDDHTPEAGPSDYARRGRLPLQDLANQPVAKARPSKTLSKASTDTLGSSERQSVSTEYHGVHTAPSRRVEPRMDRPNNETLRTPCPAPGNSRSKPRPVRTGPSALFNARRGTTVTTDSMDAGNYAVSDVLPTDPEQRQRQQDAFRAVTPITGRGPFSYYTNTAAPMTGRKRKLSTASETGSSFRTPFKVPTERPRQKVRVGLISDHRTAAIATIRDALKKSLVEGPEADRLWQHWGDKAGSRKASVKAAAVELESIIVRDCEMPDVLRENSQDLAQAVRILRTREGAKIVTGGRLAEYERDEHGKWLVLVDRVVRQLE